MAARNTQVTIPRLTWTELTDSDVSAITFQCQGASVLVVGTTGSAPAAASRDGIRYRKGQGERNAALSDLFPGVSATRVFARSTIASAVFVSHA